MDCSPQGSFVHGILQARIVELPFPSPGDLPDPGIELGSLTLQADCLPTEPPGKHRYPGLLPKLEKRILDFIHEAHISLQVELGNLINSCQHFSCLFCS